jgi:hypothetical protein
LYCIPAVIFYFATRNRQNTFENLTILLSRERLHHNHFSIQKKRDKPLQQNRKNEKRGRTKNKREKKETII